MIIRRRRSAPRRIVRALAGNGDVVDVAFAGAGAGDAHELRLLAQLLEVAGADVAHGGAEPTGELVQDIAEWALERHLPLDPLGHELQRILDVLLEVAVGGAACHSRHRAHAAITLVRAALIQIDLARTLL